MYDMREAPSPAEQRQAEAQRRLEELGKRTLEQHDAHQPHVAVGKIARADMEHGSHDHALDQPTQTTLQALREMASALELVHRASVTSGAAQSPQFRSRVDIVQQSLARATHLLRSPALRDHVQATQTVAVLRQLSSDISALPATEATPPTAATQPAASAPASVARPLSLSLGETESASGTPTPPTAHPAAAESVAPRGSFTSRMLQAHDAQTDRDAGLQRSPDMYVGTSAPVLDSTGAPISASGQRVVAGTSTRADAGFAVTPQLDAIERVHDTTTVSSPSDAPGVTVAVRRGSRTRWDAGGVTDETSGSTQRSQLDLDAMNAAATAELRARYTRLEGQHHQADTEIEDLEHTLTTTPEQQQRDLRQRRAALAIADRRRVADMAELERDLNRLATDDSEASLRAVIASHSLQIAPAYRITGTASSRQRTRGLADGGVQVATVDQDEVATDAGTTTTAGNSTTRIDLARMRTEQSARQTETDRATGMVEVVALSRSAEVSATNDALTRRQQSAQELSVADEDGNVIVGTSEANSQEHGLLSSDQELGYQRGSTREATTTSGGRTVGHSVATTAQVTNRGVAGSATAGATASGRRADGNGGVREWNVGTTAGGDGAFTTDIQQIEGSEPARYLVVVTLHAGGRVSLNGGAASTQTATPERTATATTGTATAAASGSADLTFRHEMSAAELTRYVGGLHDAAIGAAPPSNPEFGILARLHALRDRGADAALSSPAVFGNAQTATDLASGDSIELTLRGEVSASGTLGTERGGFGASLNAGGALTTSRTLRIARGAGTRVVVTVTFDDGRSRDGGGSLSFEGVTVGANHSDADSESHAAQVVLDTAAPDYQARYTQVCNATSVSAVQALATEFTDAFTHSSTNGGSVGAVGVVFNGGRTTTEAGSVTRSDDNISGEFSGGQADSTSVGLGDTPVQQSGNGSTIRAGVDNLGIDVTLEQRTVMTDHGRTTGALGEQVTSWGDDVADTSRPLDRRIQTAVQAVTTSPLERLQSALQTTYSQLQEYSLNEADLTVVVQRAGDVSRWSACIVSGDVVAAWATLRRQLVHPIPAATWSALSAAQATPANQARVAAQVLALTRAQALAHFGAATGRDGLETLARCLRNWGDRPGQISTAQDLGTMREWPPLLEPRRAAFLATRTFIRDIPTQIAVLTTGPDGRARAQARVEAHRGTLQTLAVDVAASTAFENARAKLELLDEISQLQATLREAWQEYSNASEASLAAATSPAWSIAPASELISTSTPQAPLPHAEQRRRELLLRLHQYKHEEQAIFAEVRPMIRHSLCSEGTRTDGWFQAGHADEMQASARMHDVADLHEAWIARIVELRAICTTLQLPRTAWGVSAGPLQPRNSETEPAIEVLIAIYTIDTGSIASNGSLPARTDTAAQWRRRCLAY